ncbi:tetratricopeptide repeat protein [Rubricoccus marinus]|uniref:SPOR domain-containing protein n=1 Tax=Rubricoccus marinus TaxID=716817 RepID=A0A259U1P0_9BACT|nr:tetratricopeptide repeat protein [Rubricoccus marinus]OZC03734.1 hypothetical protein BSZ36_12525 [Rubricoccus marinus]
MRPAPSARRALFSASLFASAFLLAGCGALFGSRYNDFRAYYNAYYNAERVLEEGESQLDRQDQAIDRTKLISLYPSASGGRGSGFQEAIDKSSELLRARGDSKWADDALFLIGKAYYYQNNAVGAEQKFRETIELATVRNNDRLADEARIWLGRTLASAQRYEEGTEILQDRLAAAEGNRGDLARIRLVLGELYAREGRYADAAESIRMGLEDERDSDFAARASMLLGQVLEADGRYAEAADAYREVTRLAPPYELAYAANLSRALVLGLDAEQTPEAIDLIRRMRRDDKNYAHRAEVELAYGRLLAASGEPQEALTAMRSVLYDPLMAGGSLRGETHARLAEFYRDARGDFVRAAAHFDTASTVLRTSIAPGDTPTRAALLDVRRTAGAFKAYSTVAVRLAEADSLYELGSLDDEAFAARIQEIEAQRLVEFEEEQRRLAASRASQDFAGGQSAFQGGGVAGGDIPGAGASAAAASNAGGRDLGFLSFREPSSVQANLLNFQRVWGDRGLVPNWRRSAAIEAGGVATVVGPGLDPSRLGRRFPGNGPPPLDLTPIPRTPAALIKLRSERAALRYEAANSLFFSLARPDSAAALYALALEDGPEDEVAGQIRFALAEVEAARGRADRASELYQSLIDDSPDSDLAAAARLRLGMEAPPEVVAVDSTSEAYEAVRSLWRQAEYPEAVRGFLALAADSSRATTAPRALLAASATYIEWANVDGFEPLRPLPDSLVPSGLFPTRAANAAAAGPAPEASGATPRIGVIPQPADAARPGAPPPPPPGGIPDKPSRTPQENGIPDKPSRVPRASGTPDRPVNPPGAQPERPATPLRAPEVQPAPQRELPPGEIAPSEERGGSESLRIGNDATITLGDVTVRQPGDQEPSPVSPLPAGSDPVLLDSAAALDTTIVPDAGAVPADSTTAPEAEAVLTDSTEAPEAEPIAELPLDESNEEPLAADSAQVNPVRSDSTTAVPTGPTVMDVLALVEERAPSTPYAQRAATLRAGLTPSSEAEASESAPAASGAAPGTYGFEGRDALNASLGGFTWRAQRIPDTASAYTILADYLSRSIRAAAVRDGDAYRIVVGQFETRPDAFGVREDLPAEVQGAGASIVPLTDLVLLGLDDLIGQ